MKPMMAFSGVRSSWLMVARKRSLARLAFSSSTFFSCKALLEAFPLRDVADGTADENAFFRFERAEADFDRKLAAVFPQCKEFDAGSHRPHAWFPEVVCAIAGMIARNRSGTSISTGCPSNSSRV